MGPSSIRYVVVFSRLVARNLNNKSAVDSIFPYIGTFVSRQSTRIPIEKKSKSTRGRSDLVVLTKDLIETRGSFTNGAKEEEEEEDGRNIKPTRE